MIKFLLIIYLVFLTSCGVEEDSGIDSQPQANGSLIGDWIYEVNDWNASLVTFNADKTCFEAIFEYTGYVFRTEVSYCDFENTLDTATLNWNSSSNPYHKKTYDITFKADDKSLMIISTKAIVKYLRLPEDDGTENNVIIVFGYFVMDDFVEHEVIEL